MAKNKTTAAAEDKLILETMPGADPISDAEAAPFEVDLNFDVPEEEVEFPKEDEIEEISETELTADNEETEEGELEEGETEELESSSETGESETEETVLEQDEETPRPDERTVSESNNEQREPMIPKSRFDEVLAKQKALQKKLDEATNPIEPLAEAVDYNFDDKELEYQDHILNGEPGKATALRAEIRKAERDQMMLDVQNRMGQTVQQNTEAVQLQAKAEEITAAYPQLDENNSAYNAVLTQEVMDLRDAFIVQGYTGADSLEKATKYVVGAPKESSTDVKVENTLQNTKKVANIQKKLDAAESQPPAMTGKTKVDKKVDLNVLSTEEFDALPAETLRRMRGDFG
tara:strand:+ start:788 stop:1828 length:1041 start_codon:yes stop_codon:yes gene_type:complete